MSDGVWLVPLRSGVDTHQELVAYLRGESLVCRSEGYDAHTRLEIHLDGRTITATLNIVHGDLIPEGTIALSESAWALLAPAAGAKVRVAHARPLDSMRAVRAKVYGRELTGAELGAIVADIVAGRFSDVELAAFVTACGGERMSLAEICSLTRAMIDAGEALRWAPGIVADKHSVGGLPGNRTTPIVVAICAANGLTLPKTSSRAITSPSGTADTLETLTTVALSLEQMRRVVERAGACLAWGGTVHLSPADDVLIRVERALDIDSEGQLVASVMSKKVAAGATHVVLDIPVGATAKVRSEEAADRLAGSFVEVGKRFGVTVRPLLSDGRQPVGRGIGPALEARDVLAVLRDEPDAPADLRRRALTLAGELLELTGKAAPGAGLALASRTLDSGAAWDRFRLICEAQGGLKAPPVAPLRERVVATRAGEVLEIDNRKIARIAKLAGAPAAPAAGVELAVKVGERVAVGDPLYTVHAETPGELAYALELVGREDHVMRIGEGA
jgi:thymidine phosphorylase